MRQNRWELIGKGMILGAMILCISFTACAEEDAAEPSEPAPGSEIPITHFTDQVNSEEAEAAIEEAGNIISGRGVSKVNDIFKDREMRVTPPGTIVGSDIVLSNPDLIAFNIKAKTPYGDVYMNVGFARGV